MKIVFGFIAIIITIFITVFALNSYKKGDYELKKAFTEEHEAFKRTSVPADRLGARDDFDKEFNSVNKTFDKDFDK